MSLRLRLCVENCANESDVKSNLQGIGEGEKPGASCAALLHASTEGTRTCACVSVLREGRGLECVFTHTHGIPPSPLDRCSSLSPSLLCHFSHSVAPPMDRHCAGAAAGQQCTH